MQQLALHVSLNKYLLFFNVPTYTRQIKTLIFNLKTHEVEFVKALSIWGKTCAIELILKNLISRGAFRVAEVVSILFHSLK